MPEVIYLFTGMGGEYVLSPLAAYFRAKKHKVVELDFVFETNPHRVLKELSGKRIVLISSAHPDLDNYGHKMLFQGENGFLSTLELFQYLKPEASFYVPHDLTTPIEDVELCWLPYFTASLNPLPNLWWLKKFAPAFEVGWIKKEPGKKQDYILESYGNRHKFVFFPTFFTAHRDLGVEGIFELYRPMFEQNIPIKFFNWAGIEEIEVGLRAKGAQVIPAAVGSYSLMNQADAVVCFGASSTAIEAYLLGLPLVCLDDVMIDTKTRRNYLSGAYNIKFMTVAAVSQWIKDLNDGICALPAHIDDKLLAFDFERAHDIIVNFRKA